MAERMSPKRRPVVVAVLGLATIAAIAGLQIVDDAPSRSSERTTTPTTQE